ncbi:unnamed protein product [Ectocarpus sp. 8 AP-2014]
MASSKSSRLPPGGSGRVHPGGGFTRRRGRLAKPVTTMLVIVSTGSVHAEVIEPVTSEPRPGVAVGIVAVVPEPNSRRDDFDEAIRRYTHGGAFGHAEPRPVPPSLGARAGRTPETPRCRQAPTSSVPDGRAPISSSLRGPFDTRGHWEQLGWASGEYDPLRMEKSARSTAPPCVCRRMASSKSSRLPPGGSGRVHPGGGSRGGGGGWPNRSRP